MEKVWWLLFVVFILCVVFCDLRWRRVPNALLLSALAVQLAWLAARHAFAFAETPGAHGWGDAAVGFCLGLAFFPFWKWRLMGAGDVKFFAVLGAVLGIWPLVLSLLIGSLPGIPHASWQALLIARRGRSSATRRRGVPYAAYVALAALSVALMQSSSHWCSWCSSLCCTGS
jgi:prepilin peptidase CpaA